MGVRLIESQDTFEPDRLLCYSKDTKLNAGAIRQGGIA